MQRLRLWNRDLVHQPWNQVRSMAADSRGWRGFATESVKELPRPMDEPRVGWGKPVAFQLMAEAGGLGASAL